MNSRIVEVKLPEAHPRISEFHSFRSDVAHEVEDQGNWLISYLDLMTLLFAFFVVLFAHQKIMSRVTPPEALQAQTQVESVVDEVSDDAEEVVEAPVPAVKILTQDEVDHAAIETMKSQPVLGRYDVISPVKVAHQEEKSTYEPAIVPFFVQPKHTELEQTVAGFSSALAQEAARKQVDISAQDQEVRLEINDTILFDPGKAVLKIGGQAMLERLVVVLNQQQGVISVEGHTDPAPIANAQYPSNWELSAARASAVTRYLALKGVPAERMRAVGMADTKPRESNVSLQGRAKNRRVSLALYLK